MPSRFRYSHLLLGLLAAYVVLASVFLAVGLNSNTGGSLATYPGNSALRQGEPDGDGAIGAAPEDSAAPVAGEPISQPSPTPTATPLPGVPITATQGPVVVLEEPSVGTMPTVPADTAPEPVVEPTTAPEPEPQPVDGVLNTDDDGSGESNPNPPANTDTQIQQVAGTTSATAPETTAETATTH